ncbi:hypothetical protein ACFYVK_06520 [Streptomyces chartreusis]|uniref:hypothetical protein n=1 Tax=Streptomyces chartreusis TaxID=1969 RepID=UPI003408D0AF
MWPLCRAAPVRETNALSSCGGEVVGCVQERSLERGRLAEAAEPAGIVLASVDALLTRYATAPARQEIERPY